MRNIILCFVSILILEVSPQQEGNHSLAGSPSQPKDSVWIVAKWRLRMSQNDLCHQPSTAQSLSAEIIRVYQNVSCRGFCQSSGRAGASSGYITHNVPHCWNAEGQLALVNRLLPGQEIWAPFCHTCLLSRVLSAKYFLDTWHLWDWKNISTLAR